MVKASVIIFWGFSILIIIGNLFLYWKHIKNIYSMIVFKTAVGLFAITSYFLFNYIIYKMMWAQKAPLDAGSKIRNIKKLYIGDSNKSDIMKDKALSIFIPECNEIMAYEILRHVFSILDENGSEVIICVQDKKRYADYNIFAIPFFSCITIKRLKLEKMERKSKFPLFFYPLLSLKFLLKSKKILKEIECRNEKMIEFCEIRNIKLKYLIV